MCGQCHGFSDGCPCPRCHAWHEGFDCRPLFNMNACGAPCNRCNVWHGADVCAQDGHFVTNRHQMPLHSSSLHLRAVANVVCDVASITMAPAHSDAASDRHDVGSMDTVCPHCGARFWKGEHIQCCYAGCLIIPEQQIPEVLSNLILCRAVQSNLRSYNTAMAMASVGHDRSGFPEGVFVLSGRSYHQIGAIIPRAGQGHNFAQIYILDTTEATDRRVELLGQRLDRQVLDELHQQLMLHNRYASQFYQAATKDVHELVWSTNDNIMGMQIGALVVANGSKRNIVVKRYADENSPFANSTSFIDDGHSLYHTLAYPLLFPTGAPGWFTGMVCAEINRPTFRSVSLHDYGRYILMRRER